MQAKNSVGFNTPGAASSAADLEAQEVPKSRPKPEKIDVVEKQHIFGVDFGSSWASNLQLSPPRCWQRQACQIPLHFWPALTYCFSFLRGGHELPNSRRNSVMLAHRWHIFRSWTALFCLWPIFCHVFTTLSPSVRPKTRRVLGHVGDMLAHGAVIAA